MPFAGFESFDACVLHMKEKEHHTEEEAKKICGALQAKVEHGVDLETDEKGRFSAQLAFMQPKSLSYTDEPNGDTIFHDVILMAEGNWTDNYSKRTIRYPANLLASMKIEKRVMKMDHDIFNKLPLTNEIGVIENEKFVMHPTPRWIGNVRMWATQNGRDMATLLKRKHFNAISPEMFIQNPAMGEDGVIQGDGLIFMGAATVRQGACSLCKFNEGVETMANEGDGGNPTTKVDGGNTTIETLEAQLKKAVQDKSTDVAALTAELQELTKQKTYRLVVELEAAHKEIADLKQLNTELIKKVAEQEKAVQLKELHRQIEEVTKQPVYHTKVSVTGASSGSIASQLDSDPDFPMVSVRDLE